MLEKPISPDCSPASSRRALAVWRRCPGQYHPMAAGGPALGGGTARPMPRRRVSRRELHESASGTRAVREPRLSANGDYATTLMLAEDEVVREVGLLYQNKPQQVPRFPARWRAPTGVPQGHHERGAGRSGHPPAGAGHGAAPVRACDPESGSPGRCAGHRAACRAGAARAVQGRNQKTVRADNDAREAENRSARTQLANLRQEIRRLEASWRILARSRRRRRRRGAKHHRPPRDDRSRAGPGGSPGGGGREPLPLMPMPVRD